MKISIEKLLFSLSFILLVSCSKNESSDTQESDEYSAVGIPGDTTNEGIPNSDTTNFRNGVQLEEGFSGDTLLLPDPVLEAIANDNILKNAKIGQKVKKEVNGATLYEIVFYQENGTEQIITFDSNGKRQSSQ